MKKMKLSCDLKTMIPIFFFLILLTSCLFYGIGNISINQREQEVVIELCDSQPVYILNQDENCGIFTENCVDQMLSQEWIFFDKEEGYNFDMLYMKGNKGDKYTVSLTETPKQKLVFWKYFGGGQVSICANGQVKMVELSDMENQGGSHAVIYPFKDSMWNFLVQVLWFLLIFIMVCTSLLVSICMCRWIFKKCEKNKISKVKIVFILFFIFFIFDIVSYSTKRIPNFLAFGDQCYYWDSLWGNGMSFEVAAKETRVWNGYVCFYIPYICRMIGTFIAIDPVYMWFAFISACGAILCGFTIPELFKAVTGKEPDLARIFLFAIVYFIFWYGTFSAVLMDLVGLSSFLLAVVLLLRLPQVSGRNKKILSSCVVGMLFSISISFRSVYLYGSILICAFEAICFVRKKETPLVASLKKLAFVVLFMALGFLAICIPQKQINREVGVNSFLPCANRAVWHAGTYERSLAEYSLNMTLSGSFTGYPYLVDDSHATSMYREYVNSAAIVTMAQGLDLLMSQPIDTIAYMCKKLFAGFDVKTAVSYPDFSLNKNVRFFLFSFLNYFVVGTAIYAFINTTNVKGKVITALIFGGVILPHTWTHVEWRYFLIGYVMFYYWFAYFFNNKETGNWMCELEGLFKNWKYWLYIDMYIAISFMISLDFYAGVI